MSPRVFGDHTALDSVTLDIQAGSAVGLLGPNGARKSTLISLLTGLRKPDSGVVRLFGGDPPSPATRRRLGVTPHATAVPLLIRSHIRVRRVSLRAEPDALAQLSNVLQTDTDDEGLTTLTTRDADTLVRELVQLGIAFSDLEVQHATLEEAFLAPTESHAALHTHGVSR